jgi:tRNA-2-methylthio-N6-dimethylallyladenosine synthase
LHLKNFKINLEIIEIMTLYDHNPTLESIVGTRKKMDETRQGEALFAEFDENTEGGKKFYIESYGCQMNFSDSEIVASILNDVGYRPTRIMESADLILINTCSIREKAEDTVRKRLRVFNKLKAYKPDMVVGVLGCMAERLKSTFLEQEQIVDIVVGPDSYRDLPNLISHAEYGEKGVNVFLSREETYADIAPVRLDSNGVTAFISIMRGCDNMCSFCVVPFTRGRERSRDPLSIEAEARDLFARGYREVTLLGQNVDSYKWELGDRTQVKGDSEQGTTDNEQHITNKGETVNFAHLLERIALIHPDLRIRFSTSHPKDITDEVIYTMAKYENICKYIHLPVQSGNSRILKLMNRTYDREWYINKINRIYEIIPDCAISSDMITGFCSETEEEHQDTLSIMALARYSYAYMFQYSERPGTPAAKKYADDVPNEVKLRRLEEIVRLQRVTAFDHNKLDVGKTFRVLIEGDSKKSEVEFKGRNSQNKMLVFPKKEGLKMGDYCYVTVNTVNSATLLGEIVNV